MGESESDSEGIFDNGDKIDNSVHEHDAW